MRTSAVTSSLRARFAINKRSKTVRATEWTQSVRWWKSSTPTKKKKKLVESIRGVMQRLVMSMRSYCLSSSLKHSGWNAVQWRKCQIPNKESLWLQFNHQTRYTNNMNLTMSEDYLVLHVLSLTRRLTHLEKTEDIFLINSKILGSQMLRRQRKGNSQ